MKLSNIVIGLNELIIKYKLFAKLLELIQYLIVKL